jgi:hypothetical protein
VYDPEPQHALEYSPEESIFLLVQIIDLYFYWPAQFTALMTQQTHCCQTFFFNYCLAVKNTMNPFFSGNTRTIFNLKICLESPKHRLFLFTKGIIFKNDVLKSKMMRKVKKQLGSTVKS